jgi:tRNA pseudouridine38-40 synthase
MNGQADDIHNSTDATLSDSEARSDSFAGPIRHVGQKFLLTVAYDGAPYCGWQYQPEQLSVQAALEKGLEKLLEHPVRAMASSRTDAGVHAIGQAVLIQTDRWRAPADRMPLAINVLLPESIVVRQARRVGPTFYPLRDSIAKRYCYYIYNSRKADPIGRRTHWWVKRRISVPAMQAAAKTLVGTLDFAGFQSNGSPRSSTVRTVLHLDIQAHSHMDGQLITVTIEADGFLYNMVRNIVGTLVQVGVGRKSPDWIADIISAKDRQIAGATAPPQGLCLMEVQFSQQSLWYPDE